MIEGTLSHFIRDVGTILGDFTVSASADGTLVTERIARLTNLAQKRVMRKVLDMHVRPSLFARKATVTANAIDEYAYDLPARTLGVLMLEDSSQNMYTPVNSRKRDGEAGFVLEMRQITTGRLMTPVARFHNTEPPTSSDVYAWVVEEPVMLSEGEADYGATDVTFDATPSSAGLLIDEDAYYDGSEVAVISGTYAGQIRQISDYVASTRVATVAAWTSEPTDNDHYSIISGLPRILWQPIVYDVAAQIMHIDERWDNEDRSSIRKERDNSFAQAVRAMRGMAIGPIGPSYQRVQWIH